MKKYTYLLPFLVFILSIDLHCQDENRIQNKNSVQLELGGSGIFYSINYERFIINGKSFSTSGQFGFSYSPLYWYDLLFPLMINEQYSFINHHIELGIGVVAVRELLRDRMDNYTIIDKVWTNMLAGRIGYRYQKPDGRFIWRVGFTPLLQRDRPGGQYYPGAPFKIFNYWGGISIGYSW